MLANMTNSGGQFSGPLDIGGAVKGSFSELHIFVMLWPSFSSVPHQGATQLQLLSLGFSGCTVLYYGTGIFIKNY